MKFTQGETEDCDSDDENDDDDCDGDSIVVDDDIHDGGTADVISWVPTLGVLASGRLMEFGRSIEVRHKLVIFRRNITSF